MTTILGISGSLRKASLNTALLRASVGLMPGGATLEPAGIEGIPLYDGDVEAEGIPPAVSALKARLLAAEPELPEGLALRRVTERRDLERVAAMESEVWGEDWAWLADDLEERLSGEDPVEVLVVEDGELVVSAAWLVPLTGTEVAGLWGGSTLAAYRGRGVYRALVAARATSALAHGCTVLQVDASDDSRPILERLGLRTVGGTTPYAVGAPSDTGSG